MQRYQALEGKLVLPLVFRIFMNTEFADLNVIPMFLKRHQCDISLFFKRKCLERETVLHEL